MHKGKGASEVIREHTQDLQTGNTDLQAEDSKGQFDMYSSWFQFNWVGLWKNTVPLFYALFFQSKYHLHLCFSLFSSTPLLPPFSLPSSWSLHRDVHALVHHSWGGFFLVEISLPRRANIAFKFYFSNSLRLMQELLWICTFRYGKDCFYPRWKTKMPLKQNVCSNLLCMCA